MWSQIRSRKKLVIGIVALVVIALGYFFVTRRSKNEYLEYEVTRKNLIESVELSGKVSASSKATLRFATGGLVTYLGAKEGDSVKKYQTIASIDTRQAQKILEQKLNLYAIQRTTFDQTIDDNDNSVPDGDLGLKLKRILERNQYQLENAVKDVEYQDLAIKLARLTSPISGILVSSPMSVAGGNASPSDAWIIVDPTSLEFVADLDEIDLKKVKVGQKVIVGLDAYPDLKVETTVKSISFAPKETTSGTTYEVKIPLPAEIIKDLRLGLNGTAEIILNEIADAVTIPAQAVTYKGGKVEVLVKNGAKYETKDIVLGTETANDLEVKAGLSVGDKVYVKK